MKGSIMNTKELLSKIGALAKRVVALVAEIQILAIECVIHAVKHGDVTPATQLVEACGKGVRRQSLVTWFERVGPFEWHATKFKLDSQRAKKMGQTDEAALREYLSSIKWEEARPEPKLVSVLDCSEALDQFFRKLHKQIAEGKMEVKNLALLNAVEEAAQVWHAQKVIAAHKAAMLKAAHDDEIDASAQPPATPTDAPASAALHLMVQ